jgi:hypothetical protein
MESKKREAAGVIQPVLTKLGKGLSPLRPKDSFPERLHGMLTDLAATVPDEIEWVNNGEAFMVCKPKVRISILSTRNRLQHNNLTVHFTPLEHEPGKVLAKVFQP